MLTVTYHGLPDQAGSTHSTYDHSESRSPLLVVAKCGQNIGHAGHQSGHALRGLGAGDIGHFIDVRGGGSICAFADCRDFALRISLSVERSHNDEYISKELGPITFRPAM